MAKKSTTFAKDITPKKNLGFSRPTEDIIDAPVIEVFRSKRGKNAGKVAIFLLQGTNLEYSFPAMVSDLMTLKASPVTMVDDTPTIVYEGMLCTIPADVNLEPAFRTTN